MISHPDPLPRYADAYAGYDAHANEHNLFGDSGIRNAAELCCDAHCGNDQIALRWRSANKPDGALSFEALQEKSRRLATVLANLGVGRGDRVACLLPRIPELLITAVAVWRLGALYQPLFTAFGPKSIEHRVGVSDAKVIVTDATNRPKLDDVGVGLQIITVNSHGLAGVAGDVDFHLTLEQAEPLQSRVSLGPDDPFLIMCTSGTTGPAKPLLIPLKAIMPFANYALEAMDLRSEDAFWNIADPGWGYGLYFGVIGPLAIGHPIFFL